MKHHQTLEFSELDEIAQNYGSYSMLRDVLYLVYYGVYFVYLRHRATVGSAS